MKRNFINDLMYGVGGGFASNLGFNIMGFFFLVFAVDAYGVNPAVAGTMLLVARLVDTFTDPLMGAIADKTKTKLGKYRFWVLVAGPLTGLITFLVFAAPDLSPMLRIVYLYIVYIGYSIISTAANIPYHSLTAYITPNPEERRSIVIIKQFTGLVTKYALQFIGVLITIDIFNNTVAGYRVLGLVVGLGITAGFLFCAHGVREQDNGETVKLDKDDDRFTAGELFKQIGYIFTNPSLFNIAISSSTNNFALSITGAVTVYFYTLVLGDGKYAQSAAFITLGIGILGFIIARILTKRFGNKESFVFTSAAAIIPGAILWFTFNADAPNYVVFMLALALGIGEIASLVTWIMVTDCADDVKYRTGKNGAGIASSCLTFANKFGSALGGFCAGIVLVTIGYVANSDVQPESVLIGLTATIIFAPILGHICSLLSMIFYPLNKKQNELIRETLEQRAKEEHNA